MKIVTHSGKFHADEVFAVATLLLVHEGEEMEIVRSREPEIIETGDIVVDVGGEYDPRKGRFDHHQAGGAGERTNGIPYSSLGLVWKKYGEKLSGSKVVMERIDRIFVQPIDASDNGKNIFTTLIPDVSPYLIHGVVDSYRLTWKEDGDWDSRFQECLKWSTKFLSRLIKIQQDIIEGEAIVRSAYETSKDKRLVVIGDQYGLGRELVTGVLIDLEEPIYAVLFKGDHKGWRLVAINEASGSFKLRKPLPESWRAKHGNDLDLSSGVKGGIFCHRNGFMCAAETKEAILELAKKALDA